MPEDAFAWRQRQYEERAQARADLRAARTAPPTAPGVAPAPTRSFGFQSGAGAPSEEVGRAASLVQAGNELGSPTSFNAGAGAPAPVEVVRGMRTTYTNPAPDSGEGGGYNPTLSRNTREFASPVQAGQAFNRGELNQDLALAAKTPGVTPNVAALTEKYGEYVPPEGPKIAALGEQQRLTQAAENKRPDLMAKAEADRAAEATRVGETYVATLKNYLANTFGTFDSATNRMAFKPTDENTARDALAAEEVARREGAPAAIAHYQDRQNIRSYLGTMQDQLPKGFDANAYLSAVSQNPAAWKELVSKGRALKVSSPAPPQGASALQQLGTIGEHITPEWMKPKPGVNY